MYNLATKWHCSFNHKPVSCSGTFLQVSVVGMQSGKEILPYKTFAGDEILMLRIGHVSIEEMFLEEQVRNQWLTWAYRGLGWFMMFLGANCLTDILRCIGKLEISIIVELQLETWYVVWNMQILIDFDNGFGYVTVKLKWKYMVVYNTCHYMAKVMQS